MMDRNYSTYNSRAMVYLAADDINKAVGCQVIKVTTRVWLSNNADLLTFDPKALENEDDDDLGVTFERKYHVLIGMRDDLRNEELYYVAIHEFGHSLSLDHIRHKSNVMYPYVSYNVSSHRKVTKKERLIWSNQISYLLKRKNPGICTAR